jgi:hypothetical protein
MTGGELDRKVMVDELNGARQGGVGRSGTA